MIQVNTFNRIKILFIIILAVFLMQSCKDPSEVGMELLPTSDLVSVRHRVEKGAISAYTFIDDSVRTDESATNLLGSFNDPVFGKTSIDLAMQFNLRAFPKFEPDATVDSLLLNFYYVSVYGDTSTVQKLKFYELAEPIDMDLFYFSDYNLEQHASAKQLAEFNFKPVVELDTVQKRDTLVQRISIKLDHSLAEKLFYADSADMSNYKVFMQFFKGLYVVSEPVDQGGGIVSLNMFPTEEAPGTHLTLMSSRVEKSGKTGNDTTINFANYYHVTDVSERINTFKHDYTQTAFYSNLNKETVVDSLIYVQSTGGLRSKILIPLLDNWKDSAKVAINKAELVFRVDTLASEFRKYKLPGQLELMYIDSMGVSRPPRDYRFYPLFYGGYLRADYTYRFNITQHFQDVMSGKIQNNGFYLRMQNRNSEMKRVVLKGSSSKEGIGLEITYTKLLQ